MSKGTHRDVVVMPLAGRGTRMGELSFFPKHLLPYEGKALLSHTFEQFPAKTKFHLILAEGDELTRDYVSAAHPELDVQFAKSRNTYPGNVVSELWTWAQGFKPKGSNLWIVMGDGVWARPTFTGHPPSRWLGVKTVPIESQYDYTMVCHHKGVLHTVERKPLAQGKAWSGVAFFSSAQAFLNSFEEIAYPNRFTWALLFNQLELDYNNMDLVDIEWTDLGTYDKYTSAVGVPNWHPLTRTTYILPQSVVKLHESASEAQAHKDVSNSLKNVLNVETFGRFTKTSKLPAQNGYGTMSIPHLDRLLDWTLPELWGQVGKRGCTNYNVWFFDKVTTRLSNYFAHADSIDAVVVNDNALQGTAYERVTTALKAVLRTRAKCAERLHGDLTLANLLLTDTGHHVFVDVRLVSVNTGLPIIYDLSKLWLSTHFDFDKFKKGDFTVDDRPEGLHVSLPTSTHLRQLEDHLLRRFTDLDIRAQDVMLYGALHLVCMAGYHTGSYSNALYAYSQHLLQALLPRP